MFQRLLVPHDGSVEADMALAAARGLVAQHDHPHITLLRVVASTLGAAERMRAERALEHVAMRLREDGISAAALIAVGDVDQVVASTATRNRADLIVLAPYHRQWLDALVRRSLTAAMLSRSPVPVLLWPSSAPHQAAHNADGDAGHAAPALILSDPTALVIVPLDGSAAAERALPVAAALAERSHCTLVLLRALMPVVVTVPSGEVAALERDATANAEREALDYLHRVRCGLDGTREHLGVQTMVRVGGAGEAILELAHEHKGSVIVMGARGKAAPTTRAVLGSVALRVARGAHTPVIIVPEGAALPRDEAAAG